ncbi:hypothetical protein M5689_008078 [Euphorbia peplus]|nr:hypothetical protein M5689_008078 [Euphorbia peplus]
MSSDLQMAFARPFRTTCQVNGKPFSLLVSNGNSRNLASETLVNELGLNVIELPTPHKLTCIYSAGVIWIRKVDEISFSVNHAGGVYENRVLCDVLPMGDGDHMLLGRPWLYASRAIYDGGLNRYLLNVDGKSVVLVADYGDVDMGEGDEPRVINIYSGE